MKIISKYAKFSWFLTLVKDQTTQYSLVVHFVDTTLDVSIDFSSSSIVEADLEGEIAICRDVDITNIKNELTFKEKDFFYSTKILLKSFHFIYNCQNKFRV